VMQKIAGLGAKLAEMFSQFRAWCVTRLNTYKDNQATESPKSGSFLQSPEIFRYIILVFLGVMVAIISSYLMRKLGY
jgi:hypothetical protein